MKTFLYKIVTPVFLSVLLLLIIAEIGLRSITTDIKVQSEFMDNNASKIKILVLGPSGTGYGVRSALFNLQPAFSCALAAQNFNEDYWIFTRYYEKMDSLKYLILDYRIGEFSISNDSIRNKKMGVGFPSREKKYHIYYDCPYYDTWEHKLEISGGFIDKIRTLAISTIKGNTEPFLTIDRKDGFISNGFIPMPYNENDWRMSAEKSYKGINYSKRITQNYKYLNQLIEIIEKCAKRNIKVVMVGPPIHKFLHDKLDKRELQFDNVCMDKLKKEYANFKVINHTFNSSFNEKHMYNLDHLNKIGAEKFTRIINDSIIKWEQDYIK